MNNQVFLDYVENYDVDNIQNALEQSFEILKLKSVFKPKMKVLLKVCMPYSISADAGQTTHPSVVIAVAKILTKMGVKCVLADSPYKKYSTAALDDVYLNTGMLEVANLTTCELNHNLATTRVETPNGVKAKSMTVLDVVNDVDAIINIGKVKIDNRLGYFGACANMFGLIPGEKKSLVFNRVMNFKGLNEYIIDIVDAFKDKTVLNILDGVVALEANDTPRMLSCIGVSENPYALDASILDIIDIPYYRTILKQAEERNLFDEDKPYKLVGENIDKFKVEEFATFEFNEESVLYSSENERRKIFKTHQQRVKIDPKRCKGCSICSKICPTNAIKMKYDKNGELYSEIDYDKCIFCFKCHTACPYKVVDIESPLKFKSIDKQINKYNK